VIYRELATYDYQSSQVWVDLRRQFSSGVRQRELRSVADVLSTVICVPDLTRSERRSFPLLVRWFERHWPQIGPALQLIALCDADGEPINFAREKRETMVRHCV
jgi:hypothetical protein